MTSDNCGTYAGWNRHRREDTPACEACTKAHRVYMRKWRKARGDDAHARDLRANRIRSKAVWILADRHRGEFDALVRQLSNRRSDQ